MPLQLAQKQTSPGPIALYDVSDRCAEAKSKWTEWGEGRDQYEPIRRSEDGLFEEIEKSHDDFRLEEKVEPAIASDLACDRCMCGPFVLPVILPDPVLCVSRIVLTPDHSRLVLFI